MGEEGVAGVVMRVVGGGEVVSAEASDPCDKWMVCVRVVCPTCLSLLLPARYLVWP